MAGHSWEFQRYLDDLKAKAVRDAIDKLSEKYNQRDSQLSSYSDLIDKLVDQGYDREIILKSIKEVENELS